MTESITLYGFGDNDRSGKVRWLAHELGLEVEERRVKLGEHRRAPYTDINPLAQIPTVVYRGETLIESTAASQLIAESFDEPKLWIGRGEPRRRDYLFWISAFAESLEGRMVECILSKLGRIDERFYELHAPSVRRKLDTLIGMLPDDGYVCGAFTLADIVAAYSLRLALSAELVTWSQVGSHLRRASERPAAKASRFFGSIESHLSSPED